MAKKEQMWMQCRLRQGKSQMVSYIPKKKGVKVGASVQLYDDNGDGMGFWKVESISDPVTSQFVHDAGTQHRNHRKATDI